MQVKDSVRPSPIAGQWYPGRADILRHDIEKYLQQAHLPALDGEVVGIMAPHAGYLYSGPVAAYAFAAVQGLSPEVVAVVSPMHYPYPYPMLTTLHRAYATPLGEIPVAHDLIEQLNAGLRARGALPLTGVGHDPEHSLEIELPFLQCVLDAPFRLLPVMVREHTPEVVRTLGEALGDILREQNALLVASTDLSHFYTQERARVLDEEMLRRVAAFDPQGVLRAEEEGKGFACGRGALAAVMWAARELGAQRAQILRHATSGDITGDFSRVVGYGAAVFLR
ncbi:MAG: AmmeMemoRadiSam system protein B [Anaerolineae bacterium]|nr:MAG: AmmeMemoRadiSam system protein B [Anaerolineae bacterium]